MPLRASGVLGGSNQTRLDCQGKRRRPNAGWKKYPGGHLLAFDPNQTDFEDFGTAPAGEGILTTSMDTHRGRLYGITWPKGYFFRYDVGQKEWKNFGLFAAQGEDGKGANYRALCRSIAVTTDDGSAYFSVSTGDIFRYDYKQDKVLPVKGEDLRKDHRGGEDADRPRQRQANRGPGGGARRVGGARARHPAAGGALRDERATYRPGTEINLR